MCLVAWYLFFEICRLFLCLRYNQNLIFFVRFILSEYIKSFFFVFVVYYFIMLLPVVFSCRLHCGFIKSVFAVGSEEVAVGDTLIFKNIAFFRNCLLCLFRAWFWLRNFGLFVVVVFVIDCSGWLFFIERLWFCEKEEKLLSDGALHSWRC